MHQIIATCANDSCHKILGTPEKKQTPLRVPKKSMRKIPHTLSDDS